MNSLSIGGAMISTSTYRGKILIMMISQNGLHFQADEETPGLVSLCLDTEHTSRDKINILKSPVTLLLSRQGLPLAPPVRFFTTDSHSAGYEYVLTENLVLRWGITSSSEGLRMDISCNGDITRQLDGLQLVFPFDPAVTLTSVISSQWTDDGGFQLPAIISVPDLGQMLLNCRQTGIKGWVEGSRRQSWVSVRLEIPIPDESQEIHIEYVPVVLPIPDGYDDDRRWHSARRGWFNLLEFSCGASGGIYRDVAGVWANNTLSDPVSSMIFLLGDATLLVPELAPGVSMPLILRHTLDYWMMCKTNEAGLVTYTARGTAGGEEPAPPGTHFNQYQNVMDGNPALIIGAWCYVTASSDMDWLEKSIEKLELLSQFIEQRDVDCDGIVESRQSGNAGSRPPRAPDNAWDCYCSGYKNAYINILVYRAWRCLSDLESRLGRYERKHQYRKLADKLKAEFFDTFYNPKTGWLGWWRSRDGVLHDIHSDISTSAAIAYGLIESERGAAMMERYWEALEKSGFSRFELGVPITLRPVPEDEMEYYTEFEQFLNGGCCVSNTAWLIDALYTVGMKERADLIVDAMLKRQQDGVFMNGGGFQNGFVDEMGRGAEVFNWNGEPAGYEGHLVYCWSFLHAMLRQKPSLRQLVFGIMKERGDDDEKCDDWR